MKEYNKKIVIIFGIGLGVVSQIFGANGDFTQLDQAGIGVIFELNTIYDHFNSTRIKPDFDFSAWNFLLKTNVKKYVEDYSKVLNIKDKDLMHYLNLLLQTNDDLMQKIKKVQNYKSLARALSNAEIRSLRENLAKPFLQISDNITDLIIPALQMQSYYISADRKGKANEMLIRVFNLMHHVAWAMMVYTSNIIATSGIYEWQNQ